MPCTPLGPRDTGANEIGKTRMLRSLQSQMNKDVNVISSRKKKIKELVDMVAGSKGLLDGFMWKGLSEEVTFDQRPKGEVT